MLLVTSAGAERAARKDLLPSAAFSPPRILPAERCEVSAGL